MVSSSGNGGSPGNSPQPQLPALVAHQVLGADANRPQRIAVEGVTLDVNAEIVLGVARDHACEPELPEKLFEIAPHPRGRNPRMLRITS